MKHAKILLVLAALAASATGFLTTGCDSYSGDLSSYHGNTSRSAYGDFGYYDPWYYGSGVSVGIGYSVVAPPIYHPGPMPPRPMPR
jgi:hypothetical protein